MRLTEAHLSDLWSIGKRGFATLAAVVLFFGTTALNFFPDHDAFTLSLYSGAVSSVVIIGCFSSSYRNLLPRSITLEQRRLGFVLFWFTGSLGFNILWRLPYWTFSFINDAPKTSDGLWWKMIWWSYTLHDSWYASSSEFVIAFEGWRILASTVGGLGLYCYYKYATAIGSNVKNTAWETGDWYLHSCLFFLISATIQFSNAVIYALLTLSRRQHVESPFLGRLILWGFNIFGFWASGSAMNFSYRLLLWNHRGQTLKQDSSR